MAGVVGLSDLPILGWRRSGLVKHLTALQAEDAALSAGMAPCMTPCMTPRTSTHTPTTAGNMRGLRPTLTLTLTLTLSLTLTRAGGVRDLSEAQMLEACFDRGMGTSGASAAELRGQLTRWLQLADNLVVLQGKHLEPQPLRMRLAALAAFGVATTRRAQDCKLVRQLLV